MHTDLLRAGKIPDPFVGTNEKQLQWIEHTDWEYRTTVDADAALLRHDHVEIVFQGLDTYAEVTVNGARVLSGDNMFRSWRADIKGHLKTGANSVVVHFRSPIAAAKPAYDRLGYTLPAINDQAKEMVSMFTRKAPYHYGWDWGPRFVTSGIWRPVSLRSLGRRAAGGRAGVPAQPGRRAGAAGDRGRRQRDARRPGASHGDACRTAPCWPRASARCSAGAMNSGWRR